VADRRSFRRLAALAFVAAAVSSCGAKADATLTAYAQNLTLTKSSDAFGAKLTGSVDVVLDLGHWAQGPVEVQTVGLRLFRDGNPILLRAEIVPLKTLPVSVPPSQSSTLTYSITAEQLSTSEVQELCAGPVAVSGSVTTDTQVGTTSIQTTPIVPTGCP
jgi:hypothetical protein